MVEPWIEGGRLVLDLIKDSENVLKTGQISYTNAIPKNASVEEMTGWRKTTLNLTKGGTKFAISNDNSTLLDMDLYLNWYYNGRFRGKGRYISNATLNYKINKLDSTMSLDLSVNFGSPYNASESEKEIEVHLPFTIKVHIVHRQVFFNKTSEGILEYTGEIGGEEGIYEDKTVGWYKWQREWVVKRSFGLGTVLDSAYSSSSNL